jgi:hypothetical protein
MISCISKLPLRGFNATIYPYERNKFIGLIRNCTQHTMGVYPEVTNTFTSFILDSSLNLLHSTQLHDSSNRTIHQSWVTGPEDPRLIGENSAIIVTCDTSPHWQPEISLLLFDFSQSAITSILPISIPGIPRCPQKNWLFLRQYDPIHSDFLYSSFPFIIVRVNFASQTAHILAHDETRYNFVAHNGAILPIHDGYLLTVRIKNGHSYHHSRWVWLDKDIVPRAISYPFLFSQEFSNEPSAPYEMCMTLLQRENDVLAVVSVNDEHVFFYSINLEQVLYTLLPI